MTQEEKELLIKDLCARLSYGVKIECGTDYDFQHNITDTCKLLSVNIDNELCEIQTLDKNGYVFYEPLDTIKPYLRPMESMTEEECGEYYDLCHSEEDVYTHVYYYNTIESIDWLNAHHFDYRGLIEKGLALPAKEGMYNN